MQLFQRVSRASVSWTGRSYSSNAAAARSFCWRVGKDDVTPTPRIYGRKLVGLRVFSDAAGS
jgi:D-Tyr-tRNAtyr deacylase